MILELKIYAVIITVLFLIFACLYFMYRKQVRILKKKVDFIYERNTHIELTSDIPFENVAELVNSINKLLALYEESINKLEQHEISVKETITNVSHDLRTPLTAIRGYTQMLLSSSELKPEEREIIEIIDERGKVLNQLLNQLFVFARIEAEEMELTYGKLDLNVVLRSTLVSFYQAFEERNAEPILNIAETPFIYYGDENAITRVFSNVLSNALVHGSGNYQITSYSDEKKYFIKFENSTQDIEVSDLEKIFDRFYTTDKSRTKKTTGLGLAISRKLVEKMGGNICADLKNEAFSVIVTFPIVPRIQKDANGEMRK